MAEPTNRAELIEYCKRRLGHPYTKIDVTEEQADDRVDEALRYYYDYHFDGSEPFYYKHQITANNKSNVVYDCTVVNGGTGYANTDAVVFTGGGGTGAAASITTDGSGVITSCTLSNNGTEPYAVAPTVSVTSNTGSNASITCELGGWIPMPENVIGAIQIFPVGQALSSSSYFSISYQIALNELHTLSSMSLVPYFMAFQNLRLFEEVLIGQQPIRYNRHIDRVYIDMNWEAAINEKLWLLIRAYQVVDPTEFQDVWRDRWLVRYTTALIKRQWGQNLKKFQGIALPGNVVLDGQQIYNEAEAEIMEMENEMINSFSLPVIDMIG